MKHTASKSRRILSLVLSVFLIFGTVALAIPATIFSASAEKTLLVNGVEQSFPYSLMHNIDNTIGDLAFHFDEKGHSDCYAQINADGTVTLKVNRGDMFWMPGVQIDEQSTVHVEVVMDSTPNAANTIIGPTFNITTATGVWQTGTATGDTCTGGMLYGGKPGFGIGTYHFEYTNVNGSLNEGSYWSDRWQSYSSSVSVFTAGQQIDYDISKSGNNVTFTFTDAASSTVITSQTYDDSERNTFQGAVGFLCCWEAGGRPIFTIKNYQVENALVGGVRQDFDLVEHIKSGMVSDTPVAVKKNLPVNGVGQSLPYSLTHNTDNTVGDLAFHFDEKGHSNDAYAQINVDGSVTVKAKRGDMFWMPGVQIDEQSTVHVEVVMKNTSSPGNTIIGPVFDITTETGVWRTATDDCTGGMLYGGKPGFGIGRYDFEHTNTNASLQEGSYWSERWPSYSSGISVFTVGQQIDYDISKSGDNVTFTFTDAASSTVITSQTYDDSERNTFKGAVGFLCCWENGGSNSVTFTIKNYQVENALVGGVRQDFDLAEYLKSQMVEDTRPLIVDDSTIEIETGIAFFTWKIALTEFTPDGAKLVMKKNGTTVNTVELNTLTPDAEGICTVEYYLNCESEDDVLTLCLEADNAVVAGSETFYEYGAAWGATTSTVDPVNSSELNCKAYEIDFSMVEDMTLEPGENIVAGHRWIYVRNSEDGFAKIENGKLRIKGSKGDMIIFDDLNLNKTNFRLVSEVTYLNVPQVASWDDLEAADVQAYQAYNAYFGHLVHLSEADANGNRTAFIQSCTPNGAYVMGATINPNAEEGSVIKPNRIGEGEGAYDDISKAKLPTSSYSFKNENHVDIQYFNGALGYGTPMSMYTVAGTSNNGYGKIHLYAQPASGSGGKLYANMAKQGASFTLESRVGKMGYICSEDEVEVSVGKLYVDVKSTSSMTVDGEKFPIYGGNEITVASLAKESNKVIYAQLGDEILYPESRFTPNRLTVITTKQVNLVSRKATAVGQTGLKWKFEIDKAGLDALLADPNVASVKVGMLIIPTTFANEGINRATFALAGSQGIDLDITASKTLDDTVYVFNGVRDIAKNERTVSYSAVGYIQVTMRDEHVVEQIADFSVGKHSNNLISLVASFDDEQEPVTAAPTENTTTAPTGDDVTTAAPKKTKKGCKGSVAGFAMIAVLTLAGASCACFKKKD